MRTDSVMEQPSQVKNNFLYKEPPSNINFFIYPPIMPAPSPNYEAMIERFSLKKSMPRDYQFVVFIAIPYCEIQCHSCHCFKGLLPKSSNSESFLNQYVDCLIKQIRGFGVLQRFSSAKCGAVYIGGGTGSLLSAAQVDRILKELRESFNMAKDAEINLEGNPTDFTLEYLEKVKKSGVTRLSIGYQSAQDPVLEALNTLHRREEGIQSVKNALAIGFDTLNVDLLYNVPGQTFEQWQEDVETLIDLNPHGISPGDYIVFPKSGAEKLINLGKLKQPHDIHTAYEWYLWANEKLEKHDYTEQVRGIFTKPNNRHKYVMLGCNESFDILGFGAGSFSFVDRYQYRAPGKIENYKEQVNNGIIYPYDYISECAEDKNLMERYIILNFYSSSLNRQKFYDRFRIDPIAAFPTIFEKLQQNNLIDISDEYILLTKLGKKWRKNVYYEFHDEKFKQENLIALKAFERKK